MRPSEIANAIKPFVLSWIKDVSSNSGSSGGAGTGVAVHDFLGPYHTRPSLTAGRFLASPAAATGLPDFRAIALSDIQSVADTRYALSGRLINAGGGLTGGGALTADVTLNVGAGTGITVGADVVNVNEAHPFSWSASHAFGAGLAVSGANTITMGGDVTLSRSSADLLALGSNDSMGTASFVSGFSGSGWRVAHSGGFYNAEFDSLVVRGSMRVYELLIQKIRSGNGSYLFAPGGRVKSVSGGPTYTLTFDSDHGLASNGTTQKDIVRAQKFDLALGGVYTSVLQIESIIDTVTLTATVISGAVPQATYEYVRIGNTGDTNRQGGVYITSDDTNAPYIDIYDGVSASADWGSTTKTKVRLGRLTGITDSLFGALTGYGIYTNSGYFTGGIRATSGRIDGVLDIGTSGGIYQGTGSFATPTTGLKIWNDGGVGRMGGWSAGAPQWSINTSGQFVAGTITYTGVYGATQTDDRLRISAGGVRYGVLPFEANGHLVKHIEWANGISYTGKSAGPMPYFNTYLDEPFESGSFQTSWAYWDTHSRWALNGAEIELISDVKSSLGVREEYVIMRGARVLLETTLTATGINVGAATGATSGQTRTEELYLGSASDVRLYRSAADMLRTPDGLTVDAGLNIGTASGASAGYLKLSGFIQSQSGALVLNPATSGNVDVFSASSNVGLRVMDTSYSSTQVQLYNNGDGYFARNVGIGTTVPQARLHIYDTDAGVIHNWRTTGIAGTRVTIVPNGTGDCTQSCTVMGTAYDSSGNAWELRGALESGVSAGSEQTVQVAGDATDNIHVKVKTDGQVEIVRNAGARTWSVCLSVWWR